MLQAFIDEHDGPAASDEAIHANHELKRFWERYIDGHQQRLGAFVGVLRELRPALENEDDLIEWYQLVAKPLLGTIGLRKPALDDVQEFVASILIHDEDEANAKPRGRTSSKICGDLLDVHIARTTGLTEDDQFVAQDNAQIAQQIEGVLVAFGRKMPKSFFHHLDDLIISAETRLQGLTLLSAFLRHQAPHLYQVQHTPIIDHLLKSLMNDTCTLVLSVALTSLIMLLPHVPGSLNTRLPRLFLIYSRLLCWERFSALSDEARKSLVTDDRISSSPYDHGDVGIDPSWEKCRPRDGSIEAATPELKTYYTYLYGLYPLNFMSYIRKPRKYLRGVDFPGADDFDLDQAVIRSRSDQFRQSHLLHPNFYNLTIEEELIDTKWPKMDPADVVADCHGLVIDTRTSLLSPGPPPTARLPALPPLPPTASDNNGSISPAASHTSLRSGQSWRDTQSTAVDPESPVLGLEDGGEMHRPRSKGAEKKRSSSLLDEFPMPSSESIPAFSTTEKQQLPPQNNLAYLQRETTLLRNDLNFERWHKAQYSQHIGQLMRKNVRDATVEAETLNLINANRALKQQLEQLRAAREATVKDSTLTRKQANNLEANMTERFNKLKKEQEVWAADADELRKLRAEMKTYRDLLSESEARELRTSHDLEIAKRDVEQLKRLQEQLEEAKQKVRQSQYREWDYDQAKREQELLQSEKETLQMRMRRQEQDLERTKRMYSDRIVELEAQIGDSGFQTRSSMGPSMQPTGSSSQAATQQDLEETRNKLMQLKKAHSRLLERYTDLELEYQTVKTQLGRISGYGDAHYHYASLDRSGSSSGPGERDASFMSGGLVGRPGVIESVYDVPSEYGAVTPSDLTNISKSDPTHKHQFGEGRDLPTSPIASTRSEATMHSYAGLTWKPSVSHTARTRGSERSQDSVSLVYNKTAPLAVDERSVTSGGSRGTGGKQKDKIAPDSQVRVYGRGE